MTTIITIAKANATTLTTACGITVESTSKGVPGQFDKVINLINKLPEGEFVIEASKIKGVFKALKENSKDCTTFSFVLACNGWGLEPKGDNSWVIGRPQGNITLINGSYSEPTQPEEVKVKPKTFCQLLREEWLPSRESWVIDTLKRKMRATWKARKELTCERQGKFMAEFFRRLDVYSPNTELPLQAFLTTYDLVKEAMTGQKTQAEVPAELKPVQKDHNTEEVKGAYTNHLNNLLNKFPDRSVVITDENVHLEETQEELSEGKVTIKTMWREDMKPTRLRLTASTLEKTPGLKVNPIVDHDPEIYGRVYHQGVLIGYVTFIGRVELLRGMSCHKGLFKILDKAT